MNQIETIEDFYNNMPEDKGLQSFSQISGASYFNIFPRWRCSATYLRRDYYKIVLVIGTGVLHYADKKIEINRPAIFLTNPIVPYSWEPISEEQKGWICLFTQDFLGHEIPVRQHYPLLKTIDNPIFFFDEYNFNYILSLFEKMAEEISSDYIYKYSMLKNYLQLLLHTIQKLQPEAKLNRQQPDASRRITYQFLESLEQQFPIESPEIPIQLKTPQDFADKLAIHVNHLNSSVKKSTGKTSSQLISNQIMKEAKALLNNSDWSISEIAYALGFDYPSYFTNFFKKHAGLSPKEVRKANI